MKDENLIVCATSLVIHRWLDTIMWCFYSTWIVTIDYNCKCTCVQVWRKYVMANEITRFGGFNFFLRYLEWANS
jgi:hypothetical protein